MKPRLHIKEKIGDLASSLYEVDASPSRIVPMEGLRGLAVILVFFVHFYYILGTCYQGNALIHRTLVFLGTIGHAGVDLFFLLSGFLIYGMLIERGGSTASFLLRRVKRLYPTFLVVLGIYLVLSTLFPDENKIHGTVLEKAGYVLKNLLLLPGVLNIPAIITVSWSLSYEFLFYLLLPVMVLGLQQRSWSSTQRLYSWLVIWAGYLLLPMAGCHVPVRFAMFFAGMALYETSTQQQVVTWLTRRGELCACTMFIGSLLFFYLTRTSGPGGVIGAPIPVSSAKVAALSAGCFALTLFTFRFDGLFKGLFSWAPVRWMGNISYSYYLIHGLTLKALARVLRSTWLHSGGTASFLVVLSLSFAVTWAAATILFLSVERRFSLRRSTSRLVRQGTVCAE